MKKRLRALWSRAAPVLRQVGKCALAAGLRARRTLVLYLDDLLLLGGGGCFVRAAWELLGRPWAILVAGVCLTAYAVVIARARRGGSGK